MKPSPLVLVGGGGHCASCIGVVESSGRWEIKGIVDLPNKKGELILGYEVIGTDDDLPILAQRFGAALVSVGQIKSTEIRQRLLYLSRDAGFELPVVVASTASVSRHASIDFGSIVMHGAVINVRAQVGFGCIINTAALIEHDAEIDALCHVSTRAVVNGGCRVGRGSFIGSGAILRHNTTICPGAIIGAGAVVVNDIDEVGVYVGNPARKIP